MSQRLTIVLPLKGRPLFTLRFLWHANQARLPYRFLIADGQVHPVVARLLENSHDIFPELDIEYIRYPDDVDLSRFFVKVADALRRVRTPYAMLADNDDFLVLGGIERAIDFLETNTDYVGAAGGVAGFSVYSGLNNACHGLLGRLNRVYKYYRSNDVSSPFAAERLRCGALNLWIYYAVYRTEALATICREIAEIDFSDLLFHEAFHVMRALTLGKVRLDDASVGYVRQYGTSMTASSNKYWVRQLVRGRFSSDVHSVVERISAAAARADGRSAAEIAEEVLLALEVKFEQFVRANYGSLQEAKTFLRKRAPKAVSLVQNRPRFFIGRQRAAFARQLTEAGASEESVRQFSAELAAIEEVLSGEAFHAFVQPYLPDFRPEQEPKTGHPLVRRLTT